MNKKGHTSEKDMKRTYYRITTYVRLWYKGSK